MFQKTFKIKKCDMAKLGMYLLAQPKKQTMKKTNTHKTIRLKITIAFYFNSYLQFKNYMEALNCMHEIKTYKK